MYDGPALNKIRTIPESTLFLYIGIANQSIEASKIYFAQCGFHFSRPDPSNQSMDTPIKAPIQSRDNCGAKMRDKENSNRKDFAHVQKVLENH